MKKICMRNCYDTSTGLYYYQGHRYDLEEGDIIADSDHFRDAGRPVVVPEEKAALDPALMKKTVKYLTKKYPAAAKKVDLRAKGAHRSMVYEIMKERGDVKPADEEGKTMGEQLDSDRDSKLEASRKR